MLDGNREYVAELNFRLELATGHAALSTALVDEEFRGHGLSMLMMRMLFERYPSLRTASGILIDSNRDAYITALQRGLSPEEAFRETPRYKALFRLSSAGGGVDECGAKPT